MVGYKDCPIEQFNEAMRMVRENIPVRDIPTHLLYIAFDKYRADERHLGSVASNSYGNSIRYGTRLTRDMLASELNRRGIAVQAGIKKCVHCLVNNGYSLIGYDDEIHARLVKYIDGNEFMVLVIGPHDGNDYGYILRGEFVQCFDKWSNATYQRRFSSENDFLENWNKFWMFDCE